MQASKVLIVDDEPDIRELLEITLTRMGLTVSSAEDLASAKALLLQEQFQLCLSDMRLPDGDGLSLVEHIQEHHSNLPVAIISAHGTMEIAIQALKLGAFDFVSKPVDLKQLRQIVSSALNLKSTSQSMADIQSSNLQGKSAVFQRMMKKAFKLSKSQAPIFICGESGTGKELVANFIHEQGPRAKGPFIAVNCGAIPAELMESEFFGHKKGSFTGAISDKDGFFQAANGGTLFLDEVADLPLDMQVKLLRAIQEKKVRPIGDSKEVPVDVRILSATHKNLQKAVQQNIFRQDLFYRLNVIQLDIPPLRDRQEDIVELTHVILEKLQKEYQYGAIELSDSAKYELLHYHYPGNVRELENILERAFALCDEGEIIDAEALGLHQAKAGESIPMEVSEVETPLVKHIDQNPSATNTSRHLEDYSLDQYNLDEYMEKVEKEVIEKALESTRWNKTAAAKKLGITFRALRYKLKKLNL